jgi:hypothetical protein
MAYAATKFDESTTTNTTSTAPNTEPSAAATGRVVEISELTSTVTDRESASKPSVARSSKPISIESLYQARDAGSERFIRVFELLENASELLLEARRAYSVKDNVSAASAVLGFESLLEKMFECREIGEGFANVVNTIQLGIVNLGPNPVSESQVALLWRTIGELAASPFLTFRESLRLVRELKKAGLDLNSQFLEEFASETS